MTDKRYSLGRIALDWLKDALHAQETGGLSWHMSAWLSRKRWEPTQKSIDDFLMRHQVSQSELLLIGGSAGWMMSSSWLSQFKKIKVIDIDPLAPLFFYINHGKSLRKSGTAWEFERRDGIRELSLLIKEYPESFIWFDNVLGQQCFKLKDEDLVLRQLKHIKVILKNSHWGSIHDWLSGPVDESLAQSPSTSCLSGNANSIAFGKTKDTENTDPNSLILNNQEMRFDEGTQILLNQVNATGEWQDHLSAEVFSDYQSCQLFPWYFKPAYCHFLIASFIQPEEMKNPSV